MTNGQVNFCDASATGCSDIHLLASVAPFVERNGQRTSLYPAPAVIVTKPSSCRMAMG